MSDIGLHVTKDNNIVHIRTRELFIDLHFSRITNILMLLLVGRRKEMISQNMTKRHDVLFCISNRSKICVYIHAGLNSVGQSSKRYDLSELLSFLSHVNIYYIICTIMNSFPFDFVPVSCKQIPTTQIKNSDEDFE